MATYSTVKELFVGIADAIRSKESTTDEIPHLDMPDRINALATTKATTFDIKSVTTQLEINSLSINKLTPISTDIGYFVNAIFYRSELHLMGSYNMKTIHYKYDATSDTWVSVSTLPNSGYISGYCVCNDKIYKIGGYSSSGTLTSIYSWCPESGWSLEYTMSVARYGVGIAVIDNLIYIIGGGTGSSTTSTVYVYDTVARTFSSLTSLPSSRVYLSAHYYSVDGMIHVFGGSTATTSTVSGSNTSTHYIYNISTNLWTTSTQTIPVATSTASNCEIIEYNSKLWFINTGVTNGALYSYDNTNGFQTVIPNIGLSTFRASYVYDKTNNVMHFCSAYSSDYTGYQYAQASSFFTEYSFDKFSYKNPMSLTKSASVSIGNDIYVFGSGYSSLVYTEWYKFNASTKKWSYGGNIPYNFYNGSAVVYNGLIHLFGGTGGTTIHYILDPITKTWSLKNTLPFTSLNNQCSCIVHNSEIHILGSSSATTSHYKWDSTTDTWTSVSTLPYAFYYGTALSIGTAIHIFSGYGDGNGHQYLADGTTTWVKMGDLPSSSTTGSCGFCDTEYAYIICGTTLQTIALDDTVLSTGAYKSYALSDSFVGASLTSITESSGSIKAYAMNGTDYLCRIGKITQFIINPDSQINATLPNGSVQALVGNTDNTIEF